MDSRNKFHTWDTANRWTRRNPVSGWLWTLWRQGLIPAPNCIPTDLFFNMEYWFICSFPGDASGEEPTCQCRRHRRCWFDPWAWKILWRRAWPPTPVFLPGESHGQRSLVGYSSTGSKRVGHNWSNLANPHWFIYIFFFFFTLLCFKNCSGSSLVAQWRRIYLPIGDTGSVPDPGRSHMLWSN